MLAHQFTCRRLFEWILIGIMLTGVSTVVSANPFSPGWTLKHEASSIRFQSIKNEGKVETSSFATFSGAITESGDAKISILLDSVDTKVDLRNVRMRFLFFETFQYPEAIVTMKLDEAILADLPNVRRKIVTAPFSLDLHGVKKEYDATLAVTLISDGLISVTSSEPVNLSVADFALEGGIRKLEEAANVTIVPSTSVTFDLLFEQLKEGSVVTADASTVAPASAALEAEGDFSQEACVGRFEILSRTDNIYFHPGSAELDPKSRAILDTIVDIIKRCPDLVIEVSGHTDSDGGDQLNQVLSEGRAGSVKDYIVSSGVDGKRIVTTGYGETRPVVPNDSAQNKTSKPAYRVYGRELKRPA